MILRTILEIIMVALVIIGYFYQDKLVEFENKIKERFTKWKKHLLFLPIILPFATLSMHLQSKKRNSMLHRGLIQHIPNKVLWFGITIKEK